MDAGSPSTEEKGGFGPGGKAAIVVVLAFVVFGVVYIKADRESGDSCCDVDGPPVGQSPSTAATQPATTATAPARAAFEVKALPRLLDLGRGTCIPCKQMMPILEGLRKEYAGRLLVEVIDLRDEPEAGARFGVRVIPTQIFFAPSGKELYRHVGVIPKEDIVAKWKELGFDLKRSSGGGDGR